MVKCNLTISSLTRVYDGNWSWWEFLWKGGGRWSIEGVHTNDKPGDLLFRTALKQGLNDTFVQWDETFPVEADEMVFKVRVNLMPEFFLEGHVNLGNPSGEHEVMLRHRGRDLGLGALRISVYPEADLSFQLEPLSVLVLMICVIVCQYCIYLCCRRWLCGGGGGKAGDHLLPSAAEEDGWPPPSDLEDDDSKLPHFVSNRVQDIFLEDGQRRQEIRSLFPRDMPVPSLRQALGSIAGNLPAYHPITGDLVDIARRKATEAQTKFPHMTTDECTAIVLYTMEEDPREQSLYYVCNRALRSRDRSAARPWVDYTWLLLHALKKLPAVDIRVAFRGCKKTPKEMQMDLRSGSSFQWSGFSSAATTADVMQHFLGTTGNRTMIHLELTQAVARDVREFSLAPQENELVLPPNIRGTVQSYYNGGHGLYVIQCKQTESDDLLLDMTLP